MRAVVYHITEIIAPRLLEGHAYIFTVHRSSPSSMLYIIDDGQGPWECRAGYPTLTYVLGYSTTLVVVNTLTPKGQNPT